MSNQRSKKKLDRRTLITRIVSLALAGLMLFSIILAAALTQIF